MTLTDLIGVLVALILAVVLLVLLVTAIAFFVEVWRNQSSWKWSHAYLRTVQQWRRK